MTTPDRNRHYLKSRYREKVVEHVFVGELLRHLWASGLDAVRPNRHLEPDIQSWLA